MYLLCSFSRAAVNGIHGEAHGDCGGHDGTGRCGGFARRVRGLGHQRRVQPQPHLNAHLVQRKLALVSKPAREVRACELCYRLGLPFPLHLFRPCVASGALRRACMWPSPRCIPGKSYELGCRPLQ
jgi:hypothetical protein